MTIVNVVTDQPFLRDKGGVHYSTNGSGVEFWGSYLSVFEHVRIVTRVREVERVPRGALPVANERITFVRLPFYKGLWHFVRVAGSTIAALLTASKLDGVFILRMPGAIAGIFSEMLRWRCKSYGVEVIGDPAEVFKAGILRAMFVRSLKRSCSSAVAVAYVNRTILPKRYPPGINRFSTSYSNVQLRESDFVQAPRSEFSGAESGKIVLVGTMDQMYKGFDVFIRALAILRQRGLSISAVILGDGKFRSSLEFLAASLNVEKYLTFAGRVGRAEVIGQIDEAVLFVMASRTEGMPRALLEAMARGVPAVGTAVGGIPELLDERFLIKPNDPVALADVISKVIESPQMLAHASALNLSVAREYSNENLLVKRKEFYSSLI